MVRKCLYLYLSQITEGTGGGGGNSHLILVHLCRRYFSDPPYSCIPEADCRNVYLLTVTYSCTVRLPVPGHLYSCVVSKYLLRENEISFLLLLNIITPLNNESQFV